MPAPYSYDLRSKAIAAVKYRGAHENLRFRRNFLLVGWRNPVSQRRFVE
ncbi:MAG: hypothetical protein F6K45_02170 [Kamptonema sp. SIO1D9]|nr:hypothetical protein [Kamptonema sp. SIO1D9]